MANPLGLPEPSPAKVRNLVATLGAHFAKPETYDDEAWAIHLEATARLLFVIAMIGGPAA